MIECKKHPKYHAVKRPKANCETCWLKWFDEHNRVLVID